MSQMYTFLMFIKVNKSHVVLISKSLNGLASDYLFELMLFNNDSGLRRQSLLRVFYMVARVITLAWEKIGSKN